MLELQQVNLRPLDVLVGYLGDVLVAPECFWVSRSHQVGVNQLKADFNLVISGLGASQLVTLAHGAHAVVWHKPIEAHPTGNQIIQEIRAFAIEVSL